MMWTLKLMMRLSLFSLLCVFMSCQGGPVGKHLFILSGQSNMQGLRPEESFMPRVVDEFGEERVIVVKSAKGGQPIRRWYRDWQPPTGREVVGQPDLYDSLMAKVSKAIDGQSLATVTFIWMQGERDAREALGEVYAASLNGLYDQLSADLGIDDMHFIVGRLSDFDMTNAKYPHWTMVRDIQVDVAESNPRFAWIDTDDLNDGQNRRGEEIANDLHMSVKGYEDMGKRFADEAIALIRRQE